MATTNLIKEDLLKIRKRGIAAHVEVESLMDAIDALISSLEAGESGETLGATQQQEGPSDPPPNPPGGGNG